jgi:hypothetical protein
MGVLQVSDLGLNPNQPTQVMKSPYVCALVSLPLPDVRTYIYLVISYMVISYIIIYNNSLCQCI